MLRGSLDERFGLVGSSFCFFSIKSIPNDKSRSLLRF